MLLAHLSTRRIAVHQQKTGIDHVRDFPPMLAEIKSAWEKFLDAIKGTRYESLLLAEFQRHDLGA